MSMEMRERVCSKLYFQDSLQKRDLLNPELTNTNLIALIEELQGYGFVIEVTAVRSDHHDDSALGLRCHANGYCIDCWPLNSDSAGDYMPANSLQMGRFLKACATSPYIYQIGLAGGAWNPLAIKSAGDTVFRDDGADHVHLGVI